MKLDELTEEDHSYRQKKEGSEETPKACTIYL